VPVLLPSLEDLHDQPDRPQAVSVDGRDLSRGELTDAVEALAERLIGAGVVAVDATPTLETLVAVLGGLRAGVAVVPVAPDAGPLERAHILRDSGAPVFLATREDRQGDAGDIVTYLVDVEDRPKGRLPDPPKADGPALVLYTSGTTGPPKGVVIGRSAIAADLDGLAAAWGWTAEDVVVHGLPLSHVHGLVVGVLGALRVGSRFVHVGKPTPEAYAAAAAAGGTMFFGVPTVWGRIATDPAAAGALRTARLLVSGSAGLPRPTFERLEQMCGQAPIERYGMTETLITLSARYDGPRIPGSVGAPVEGVMCRVVDEHGHPVVADGEAVGSLHVRGSTLMTGYLDRPEATAASFTKDGWFVTGDAAILETDGSYRIVGRESSELIKTGGFRVGAGEVEGALLAHPGVREAAVVGRPDPDLGEVLVAYVVADGVEPAELIAWVADGLSAHKRPREVILVDELPRNSMGKVQKSLLDGR
jgi:fatty acid CoA ligase FadD36